MHCSPKRYKLNSTSDQRTRITSADSGRAGGFCVGHSRPRWKSAVYKTCGGRRRLRLDRTLQFAIEYVLHFPLRAWTGLVRDILDSQRSKQSERWVARTKAPHSCRILKDMHSPCTV